MPCGLVAGLSHRCYGCKSDSAFQDEIVEAMLTANDAALGDGIFSRGKDGLFPIPDATTREVFGFTDAQCVKYSALRIIVEWVNRYLKLWFPFSFDAERMTSAVNRTGFFRVSELISNALVFLRGSQIGLFCMVRPFNGQALLHYYLSLCS